MRKMILAVLAAVVMMTGLTACGGDEETYRPAAYGEKGACYYVDDPQEAIELQRAGYCGEKNHYWTPMIMPIFWHQMYYPYYSSPAYYNNYVPVVRRTTYQTNERTFGTTYKSEIKRESAKAKYKSSKGKIVTGNKVKSSQFAGTRNKGGSGSRTKTCSLSNLDATGFIMKGGGGGSRSGGGGGSRSTTKTTTKTKTNTGGC
jgi:hypothetical protein